jgi:tRNA threonylcarbamoyladenosine modification (KEOPS) complex  Pcc1 subunit
LASTLFGAEKVKAKATVKLTFPSDQQLQMVLTSLKPETKSPSTHRAQVTLRKQGRRLVLTTKANDTVALRASLNAYLRWINSILNVLEVIEAA